LIERVLLMNFLYSFFLIIVLGQFVSLKYVFVVRMQLKRGRQLFTTDFRLGKMTKNSWFIEIKRLLSVYFDCSFEIFCEKKISARIFSTILINMVLETVPFILNIFHLFDSLYQSIIPNIGQPISRKEKNLSPNE